MKTKLKPSLEKINKNISKLRFQQDNNPKHTCNKAKNKFKQLKIAILDWPAQSPDLNPIENVWHWIKDRLKEYREPPAGQEELWDRIELLWRQVPVELCKNVIYSMPNRLEQVLKRKGKWSDY